MAAWMELAKPGAEHDQLGKSAGTWTCEVKCFQGAEPTVSKGKMVRTPVLGGRYLREEFECDMGGMPFQGLGFAAFNNATKEWEVAWMDNMGTGIMLMKGTEVGDKTYEFTGSCTGPGGVEMKHRMVTKHVSDDKQTMEMYCDQGSGEMKCMEQTYTRSK
jgi:hypothetical protein